MCTSILTPTASSRLHKWITFDFFGWFQCLLLCSELQSYCNCSQKRWKKPLPQPDRLFRGKLLHHNIMLSFRFFFCSDKRQLLCLCSFASQKSFSFDNNFFPFLVQTEKKTAEKKNGRQTTGEDDEALFLKLDLVPSQSNTWLSGIKVLKSSWSYYHIYGCFMRWALPFPRNAA